MMTTATTTTTIVRLDVDEEEMMLDLIFYSAHTFWQLMLLWLVTRMCVGEERERERGRQREKREREGGKKANDDKLGMWSSSTTMSLLDTHHVNVHTLTRSMTSLRMGEKEQTDRDVGSSARRCGYEKKERARRSERSTIERADDLSFLQWKNEKREEEKKNRQRPSATLKRKREVIPSCRHVQIDPLKSKSILIRAQKRQRPFVCIFEKVNRCDLGRGGERRLEYWNSSALNSFSIEDFLCSTFNTHYWSIVRYQINRFFFHNDILMRWWRCNLITICLKIKESTFGYLTNMPRTIRRSTPCST